MKKCKLYVFLYKNKNNNFDCTNSLYSAKSPHVPLEEEMGQLSKKKRAICWSIFLFVYVCYVQIGFGGVYKLGGLRYPSTEILWWDVGN